MLNIYYYIIFAVFAVIAYMMIVDQNVVRYIDVMFQLLVVNIKKWYYIAVYHPGNKFTTWTMNYRIDRMTRQLQKELDSKKS